mmetsp:Transcript_62393/g.115817  ORF Transcript_62393/g.115817 Transcript_62393/m.115817 type:complete len:610 (-) Transcript_62393:59-1888(-)
MGEVLAKFFINPATPADGGSIEDSAYGMVQVLFLGGCYFYIIMLGCNLISDGSELLLLVPSFAGIIGSIVLPVLGAVPDGAIVLFSGLGPKDQVEQQLSVGVGALAGSTVMLLTVPWSLAIFGGLVPVVDGAPVYSRERRSAIGANARCCKSGVAPDSTIRASSIMMLVTGIIGYLMVEMPALVMMNDQPETASHDLRPFAWAGVAGTVLMFFGYLALQLRLANQDSSAAQQVVASRQSDMCIRAIEERSMNLRGVLTALLEANGGTAASLQARAAALPLVGNREDQAQQEAAATTTAIAEQLRGVVKPFFNKFDIDRNGQLSREELAEMLHTLGERVTHSEMDTLFNRIDQDRSGSLDFEECVAWMSELLCDGRPLGARCLPQAESAPQASEEQASSAEAQQAEGGGATGALESVAIEASAQDDDADDEEPEVPEDIRDLKPDEQRRRILRRSFWQMGCGTLLVLFFSDPMVDVLDTLGARCKVPSFYVAFLLAPLASNASEMLASYSYAQKKTQKAISISFAQLLGAACMNNTFCLGIFYLLVAARGLSWGYHAEVCGILAVEVLMGLMAFQRVHRTWHAVMVFMLLPFCLMFVYVLKATVFAGKES